MAFWKQSYIQKDELLKRLNQISEKPVRSLSDERAIKPLSTLLHTENLHHLVNQDKDLRESIILYLMEFGQKAVKPLSSFLIYYPDENEPVQKTKWSRQRRSENHMTYSRIIVAKSLATIGGAEALAGLIEAMQQEHLSVVLRGIASAIASFGNETAIQSLIEILVYHHLPGNRKVAAIMLRNISQPDVITALTLALKDESADVAISAVQSLGKLKAEGTLPFLVEIIHDFRKHSGISGAELHVADAVLNTLQTYGTDTTNDIIVTGSIIHLTHDEPEVRSSAAYRLGEMQDERAIAPLLGLLNDKAKKGQYSLLTVSDIAKQALRKIGTLQALKALNDWEQNNP